MVKSKHVIFSLLAFMLAVTLFPFSALALTENILESAPELNLAEEENDEISFEESEDDYEEESFSYIPDYWMPNRGTVSESKELNLPRLTDAELAIVQELLSDREPAEKKDAAGRHYAASESYSEARVYPLNPEDFNGETFYVILPDRQMDKKKLQNMLSAFEELGISFDPDSLGWANCSRGTSLSYSYYSYATRGLSEEEKNRMAKFREQVRRGTSDQDNIAPSSSCRTVLVKEPESSGQPVLFCFYPYRPMTDNELASFALAQETAWEIHPDQLEKKARENMYKLALLPLSMVKYNELRSDYGDSIHFMNYYRIDPDSCGNMYASPDETPEEAMVEQTISVRDGNIPAEAVFVCISVDYPYSYESAHPGKKSVCSDEKLKAAAWKWTEKNLLIPQEDILSDWIRHDQDESWGTVTYRLLTSDWVVYLEMYESNARYFGYEIYNRDRTRSYNDWEPVPALKVGISEAAGPESSVWEITDETIDDNARKVVRSLLNLPSNMISAGASKEEDKFGVLYRNDYTFDTAENSQDNGSPDRMPDSMIVYQTPYFTKTGSLRTDPIFFTYPDVPDTGTRLSDEEYLASARNWAEKTLLIPEEDILSDWTMDPDDSGYSIHCHLDTRDFVIYLQMFNNGEVRWCGIYQR